MTSPATRKTPAPELPVYAARARRGPFRARRGFTLFEVVLATGLLALLVGMAVMNFAEMGEARWLDEGARRTESLLLLARAEAARIGKALQLEYITDEQGDQHVVITLLEQKSDSAELVEYTGGAWKSYLPDKLVTAMSCRVWPADSMDGDWTPPGEDETTMEPIVFYPDGTSDSAVITLTSLSDGDDRYAVVEIDGLTGVVERRTLSAEEYEAHLSQ